MSGSSRNGIKSQKGSRLPASSAAETAALFDRVPPQDLDAERSVLGSCLLQSEVIDDVLPIVRADCFYADAHRVIFHTIVAMYEAGVQGIDPVTLSHELQKRGELESVGGPTYLVQILETVPHAAHAEYYARIVRDKWRQRTLIEASTETLREAYDSPDDTDDLIARAEQRVHKLLDHEAASRVSDAGETAMLLLDDLGSETSPGLPTGFAGFDGITSGGLHQGTITVIAARTSVGKTALAGNIALSIGQSGHSVLFVTLEQSTTELMQRFASLLTGIPAVRIKQRKVSQSEHQEIVEACEQYRRLSIRIGDSGRQTVQQIASLARLIKRRNGLDVLIVDYLQLIEPDDKRAVREQQVAAASRSLKGLARDLGIPIILLAQLNRGVDHRENKRPRLSDLRESGAIEQDADIVAFIDRPATHDKTADKQQATLIVAKNRHGACGDVPLRWHALTMRFTEPELEDF